MTDIIRNDIEEIIYSDIIDWKVFDNKRVLVTGANGMLPSYIVLTLLELNRKKDINVNVVALVRNRIKASKIFSDYLDDPHLNFVVRDVSLPLDLNIHCDYVIHAASQASPKYYGIDPVGTLNANILGTHYLLEYSIKNNVTSFLFFSTGGVYGQVDEKNIPMKESVCGYLDCRAIRNCYFESKRMGENMCACYAYQHELNAKSIRVFHTYGPTMNINDGRAFSDFCKNISEGNNIILYSDGSASRSFCYITDAIKAYFLILVKGEKGESYNVGNVDQEISIKDLADKLINLYPEKGLKVVRQIQEKDITYDKMKSPVRKTLPDTSMIEKLGWKPIVDIKTGFKRTIDSIIQSNINEG